MDLLLLSKVDAKALPAVGEIKAATEQVGPTFALIQSLAYVAELATTSQWIRMGKFFPDLKTVCVPKNTPRLDIIVILEAPVEGTGADLELARTLAEGLVNEERVSESIRKIEFLQGQLNKENEICIDLIPN